jgi:hypothetical protein
MHYLFSVIGIDCILERPVDQAKDWIPITQSPYPHDQNVSILMIRPSPLLHTGKKKMALNAYKIFFGNGITMAISKRSYSI